jgi:hypothetical protein
VRRVGGWWRRRWRSKRWGCKILDWFYCIIGLYRAGRMVYVGYINMEYERHGKMNGHGYMA